VKTSSKAQDSEGAGDKKKESVVSISNRVLDMNYL